MHRAATGPPAERRTRSVRRLETYQLALRRPGTSPHRVATRSLLRPRPNLRYTPRGRPDSSQRLRWRTGLASRGSFCSLVCASIFSSYEAFGLITIAFSSARLAAYFLTSLVRLMSRLTIEVFAIAFLSLSSSARSVAEREAEGFQQRLGFFVGLGGGGNGDIYATHRVDRVEVDFREDDLFLDTEVVVATAIEGATGHTAEVAGTRQRDIDQAIQEFPHVGAAQGDLAADRPAGADLERGHGHARRGRDRLLTGDLGHVRHGVLEDLLVAGSLAHTHVQGDLGDARNLHHVLVAEPLGELRNDLFFVKAFKARHDICSLHVQLFAVGAEHADLAPIFERLGTHALTLAGGGVERLHIGDVDRGLALDDAAGLVGLRIRLGVALDDVHVGDEHAVAVHAQHVATLALVLAGDHEDLITLADTVHGSNLRSKHIGREGDDLHELLAAQLTRNRPENAGAARLELVVEEHRCNAVETDQRAIGAAHARGGTHHHGVVNLALFHLAARKRILHGDLDDVTDRGIAAMGTAEHLAAHQFLGAAVVG